MPSHSNHSLQLCLLTDDKPGHKSQLQGLLQGFQNLVAVDEQWLSVSGGFGATVKQLRQLPSNSLLVGAGRKTWRFLVWAKYRFGLQTVVLMRPRLWPLRCFDYIVPPRHDGLTNTNNIIVTEGALNPIQPAQELNEHKGLVLIGGPSQHYGWDNEKIAQQIKTVVGNNSECVWHITNSRRTPEGLLQIIQQFGLANIEVYPCQKTPNDFVRKSLNQAGKVWVSEDSMSMVFESLSAGGQVGLLQVPRKKVGRVTQCIDDLIQSKKVVTLSSPKDKALPVSENVDADSIKHSSTVTSKPLQEANRVAEILLSRLQILGS